MQGIPVAPGLTDIDFEGEIKVMTHSQNEFLWYRQDRGLHNSFYYPTVQTRNRVKGDKRERAGFGSSDAYCLATSHRSTVVRTHFAYKWANLKS